MDVAAGLWDAAANVYAGTVWDDDACGDDGACGKAMAVVAAVSFPVKPSIQPGY